MDSQDETRPLLDAEAQPKIAKLPAHHVISKKTRQTSFPVDYGLMPWLQVLGGWVLFATSWYVNSPSL
jgi:hypothetical protein